MKVRIINRFGVIPNELLNDKNISFKAKGLYGYMQSKPDGWEFSAKKISSQTTDGVDGINSGLQELEKAGWLERNKFQDTKGMWEWEYVLFATVTGKAVTGLAVSGKARNISNKELSNKEEIRTTATPTLEGLRKKAQNLNADKNFDVNSELQKMELILGSAEDIMATYFRDKKMDNEEEIPSKKVLESLKGRFYKTAKLLAEYNYQKVLDKMEELQKKYDHEVRIKGEMNATKWTLETVLKEFQK